MRKPNANDAAELKSIGKWARVGLMHLAPIAASQILGIDFLPVAYPAPESIGFFLARFSPRDPRYSLSANQI